MCAARVVLFTVTDSSHMSGGVRTELEPSVHHQSEEGLERRDMSQNKFDVRTDKYWVTEHNFFPEVRCQITPPQEVRIHDVTLREAEQSPHVVLRPDEKMRIYQALDELGVYSIELFPIISEEDKAFAREICKHKRRAKVVFLCRWFKEEVDFALECGADAVVVEGTGNTEFGKFVLNVTPDEMYKNFVETTLHATRNGLFTTVMPWDSNRGSFEFMERIYKGVVNEGGANHVAIADTFGCAIPWATAHFVKKLREWVPGVPVEMHAHNDFGLATSVMLSAVAAGAQVVHTAINSLGERAGNAATDEVALGLELLLGVKTGINLDKLYPAAHLVAELAKIPVARNKPVTGDNEFTCESGMVAYCIDKFAKSHVPSQAYNPDVIGREGFNIILGKMSGAYSVDLKLKSLGFDLNKDQIKDITEIVKNEGCIRKWSLTDSDTVSIVKTYLASTK
jgi:2-isopropylmalate synthase